MAFTTYMYQVFKLEQLICKEVDHIDVHVRIFLIKYVFVIL